MKHALILPILLPLFTGGLLLVLHQLSLTVKRAISMLACWALLPIAIWLVLLAGDGELRTYALGGWQAPFGIVLVLDRLAALMLLVNAFLAAFALLYACRGDDEQGPNFHTLFQFQLLGINGAFLTGDLFNLFVFFEILLIASYALLLHGNSARQVSAGMHYVVLNLLGSSFFLIGISMLYGLTGTLNMADLAVRVGNADAGRAPLIAAAGFLLLVVFGLKAAMVPLHLWLPKAYATAPASVAALFAIMTKVGIYAILRVFTLIFGSTAGAVANLLDGWLWPLALVTLAIGILGVLAARELRQMLAQLVIVSVGTLLAGIALGSVQGLSAALYYLIHSTMVAGGLFLLADLIVRQRGNEGGRLVLAAALRQPLLLGSLFFFGAISVIGLPPFSGFLGKLMLLRAVEPGYSALALWSIVLIGGLGMVVAMSRAGSLLFWRAAYDPKDESIHAPKSDGLRLLACIALLSCSLLLVILAKPLQTYIQATAAQLLDLAPYRQIVGGGNA
ncbi:monovalent cation/H+ antiporter subunit D [Azomonas macrocytogenes]|uniref:Multicomponent K+:H+ antiporter subunit D n=1 Tax=Azomonas macrocytogenes TaxID=69962 RepID=A0A839SYQ7_AZOMA|nr:monovalent cation/H+ antiporter subunit D [Azomonas macrocytogenes]MBB3102272.1 multicomponent K+:H+ antiporter subunit D [Azomonas macrocytogenes]